MKKRDASKKQAQLFYWVIIFVSIVVLLFFARFIFIPEVKPLSAKQLNRPVPTQQASASAVILPASPSATPTSTLPQAVASSPAVLKPAYTGFCLNAPVLFYHHIQPYNEARAKGQAGLTVDNVIFDQQMNYLASHGYTAITVKQLVEALRNHTQLPVKNVSITFDDGYKDNYTYAFQTLKKYNLKVNLMLATGLMGGADYLSWDQVSEMNGSGLFYFTDHTWSHYAVGRGPSDKIKFEIDTAKQQIQDHTGQSVDIFTYPYGSFSNNAIAILQQSGFVGAFSTNPGTTQCDSFIMTLHRTRVGNANLASYGF